MTQMAMIKRGDGSTGHITEAADADEKGVCSSCGRLFKNSELVYGKCTACKGEPVVEAKAETKADDEPKSCCCDEKKDA